MKKCSLLNLLCVVILSVAPFAVSIESLAQDKAGNGCDQSLATVGQKP